jgi:hypothetical protein
VFTRATQGIGTHRGQSPSNPADRVDELRLGLHQDPAVELFDELEARLPARYHRDPHGEKHAEPIRARSHVLKLWARVVVDRHANVGSSHGCPGRPPGQPGRVEMQPGRRPGAGQQHPRQRVKVNQLRHHVKLVHGIERRKHPLGAEPVTKHAGVGQHERLVRNASRRTGTSAIVWRRRLPEAPWIHCQGLSFGQPSVLAEQGNPGFVVHDREPGTPDSPPAQPPPCLGTIPSIGGVPIVVEKRNGVSSRWIGNHQL